MKKTFLLLWLALGLSGQLFAQNIEHRITVWDGTQWSHGAPDAVTDAIIAADFITSDDLSAFNLTVRPNVKLTMSGSSKLKLFNKGVVEQNGKIIIEEPSEFIQKNQLALTPSMDFPRKTGYILKYDYTYFCSPVSGQVINEITDYGYPGGVGAYQNPNGPNGTDYLTPRPDKYWTWNEAATPVGTDNNLLITGAWQNIDSTTVMNPNAKGYIVRAPDSFPDGPATGTAQQMVGKIFGRAGKFYIRIFDKR